MPQLDFFTFTHQFLFLISCFFGMYYFNLLFLFPRIRWFYLNRFIFFKFVSFETYCNDRWALGVVTLLLTSVYYYFLWFKSNHYKLINKAFFWNVAFTNLNILEKKLFLLSTFCFIFFIFFLKNILIFNAEKLMFIYFCLVVFIIVFFTKKLLNDFIQNESKKLILVLINNEYDSEKKFNKMFILLKNLKIYIMRRLKNFILLNNLKLKKIKIK